MAVKEKDILAEITGKVDSIKDRVIRFRREIHRNPELSGEEERTAAFVAGVLGDNDIEVRRNVGGHGVVGLLKGGAQGPTIALRADMDALPIQDRKGVEYASSVPGVMHACGHDVHTSVLMGTAVTLRGVRERLKGNVKFIFQPSEERATPSRSTRCRRRRRRCRGSCRPAPLHCFPEM